MNKYYNCDEGCSLPSSPNDLKILINQLKREIKEIATNHEKDFLKHDGKIAEMCKYIKDNLSNSIRCLLDTMLASGELDKIVNSVVSELIGYDFIDVKKYGATGNGIDDDTIAIKNACLLGGRVVFPEGTYLVSDDINISSNTIIDFNGAIIKRKATDLENYSIFSLQNVENVVLNNPIIIGDRDEHIGSTGEWGMGVSVVNCKNITINNAEISKTWGDGIYIGESNTDSSLGNKDINVFNTIIDSVSRNGISITSGDGIKIKGCKISNTDRTLPKAGIDIEPNKGYSVKNVVIDDIETSNNLDGILIDTQVDFDDITITNHKSSYDEIPFFAKRLAGKGTCIYKDAHLRGYDTHGIKVQYKYTNSKLILKDVLFNGKTNEDTEANNRSCVYIQEFNSSFIPTGLEVGGIEIDNMIYELEKEFVPNSAIVYMSTMPRKNIHFKNIITELPLWISGSGIDISTAKISNCEVLYKDEKSITIDGRLYYNKTHQETLTQQRAIYVKNNANVLNTEYEIYVGNVNGFYHIVEFQEFENVYYNGNNTSKKFKLSSNGGYMRFKKVNGNIYITDNVGYEVA